MFRRGRLRTADRRPARRAAALLWVIAILAVAAGAAVLIGGRDSFPMRIADAAARRLHPPPPGHDLPGQWSVMDDDGDGEGHALSRVQRAAARKLLSLGYAAGTRPPPARSGTTRHDPARSGRELMFFVSGHAPEALLITRAGEVRHRWHCDYRDVAATGPDAFLPPGRNNATGCWRRAHLFPDGGILAIYEGHGLVRLDRDSRLLWAYPGHCHHDLHVDDDGRIWVLTREAELAPRFGGDVPALLDYFTVLSPEGKFERRIPLLAALESSPFASLLDAAPAGGDVFHTNTLERLDGSLAHLSPLFARGNILTSIRELNALAILDPRRGTVVWALTGPWVKQHQPTLLPTGRLLLFDNLGRGGRSQVLEVDPLTREIVWRYADGPDHRLFSATCGSAQRLPGGNTLIVESDNGRALEVTPDGVIVWEYRNEQRAGEHGELIAAILDMVALPEGFPVGWLDEGGVRAAGARSR
ncbi:MAG: arylsulfotransferase family protein [bacterium]|nr:arylsulfotransferase family protein [bacterium]